MSSEIPTLQQVHPHVFDHRLEFSAILLGNLPAKDDGGFVWLTEGPIGVQQPFSHFVQSGASAEDQVVAEFDLGKEQAMLATGLLAFPFGKKASECSQPFLTTVQDTGLAPSTPLLS
jgi:hypothetical protein